MMRCRRTDRRGVVLAVVLLMIGLLALVMVSYLFFIRSEQQGIVAFGHQQQSRLVTDSGYEELVSVLRADQHNIFAWFDNPQRFRHALVWAEQYEREDDPLVEIGSRLEYFASEPRPSPAWRYSLVAPRLDGPEGTMRFGVTPEAGKLNINVATDAQITQLVSSLLFEMGIETPGPYVAALLDWLDEDGDAREGGAEDEYYTNLDPGPPYSCKNGPLDTLEELLLVKGFNAALLYGEDVNRNGILDQNEDDGEDTFPFYDNGDGILNHGIAPYLTVFSRETDTALDNKPRINLNADINIIQAQIAEYFPEGEISAATVAFIASLKQDNFDFVSMGSPAGLYGGEAVAGPPAGAGAGEAAAEGEDDPNRPAAIGSLNFAAAPGSPVTLEEMPYLMDRFTVRGVEQAQQPIVGLIHVSTAPARVLGLIPGMNPEILQKIMATRAELGAEELRTTAWPLVYGGLSADEFRQIAPFITTKSVQFHVEVLGYADHLKAFRRGEWVIEMIGPLPQVKYHRDLTRLGMAWPIDDDEVVVIQPE